MRIDLVCPTNNSSNIPQLLQKKKKSKQILMVDRGSRRFGYKPDD
jgi:hypothetical protein